MIVFNYTKIKRREKRVYALFNTTISTTGILSRIIYTCVACIGIFTIPGLIICKITNNLWYNPINLISSTFAMYFYSIFIFLPIAIGIALNNIKIQNCRLLDYLKMYFTPKIQIDQNGKKLNINAIKINSFVEKI